MLTKLVVRGYVKPLLPNVKLSDGRLRIRRGGGSKKNKFSLSI
jgi:hypothetical protein